MIAIHLSKQQALDANPKAIKQTNFTGTIEPDNGAIMFFIIEKAKETISNFLQGTVKVLWMCSTILFWFNIISVLGWLNITL